ncbi:MAG: F0F1 ATP synthase subunit gamma [Alphaproteobacteria bacterium]|nr:F0F1 ATP synthase subunit gamma [Alphaproteobacteria bacterium]
MANLKDLRVRIESVKSTQKITSAMKMVAASKFKRAQDHVEASRPYTRKMLGMMNSLASGVTDIESAPKLLVGTGKQERHLVIVASSDRGLCGGFNATIIRDTRRMVQSLKSKGKEVFILTIGRKAKDMLRREFSSMILDGFEDIAKPRVTFAIADKIAKRIIDLYEEKEIDVCTLIFNQFKSALTQIVTRKQMIPALVDQKNQPSIMGSDIGDAIYTFEPNEEELLHELLPKSLAVQLYGALLENAASEQGARMTAMDNATRNAGDMIKQLRIKYNRTRQAVITKELIEVISGAEAL